MVGNIIKGLAYLALMAGLLLVIALAVFMIVDVTKGIIEIWPT